MNDPLPPDRFDARTRHLHAQSLAAVSPLVLTHLRAARHAASRPRRRRPAWLLATACSALLAVGLGLQLHRDRPIVPASSPQAPATVTASDDDALEQNPDLYVWLGSENALAME
ncbi:MAG: hypothetical protein QM581_10230 [Pseudomonas sp.]